MQVGENYKYICKEMFNKISIFNVIFLSLWLTLST